MALREKPSLNTLFSMLVIGVVAILLFSITLMLFFAWKKDGALMVMVEEIVTLVDV